MCVTCTPFWTWLVYKSTYQNLFCQKSRLNEVLLVENDDFKTWLLKGLCELNLFTDASSLGPFSFWGCSGFYPPNELKTTWKDSNTRGPYYHTHQTWGHATAPRLGKRYHVWILNQCQNLRKWNGSKVWGGGSINACHITNKYALMQVLITWIAKDVRWTNSAWCQQNSGVSKICVPPARQMFQARNSKQDLENPTAPRRVRDPSGDPWLF